MLAFTPIASGSTGNLYRLQSGENTLMIEAGIRFSEIRKAFDFQLSSVSGCLITHAHKDHAMSAEKLMAAGVDCYMTAETADQLKLSGHRLHIIVPSRQFKVGPFSVVPFSTEHDCPGSVGFLISDGKEKMVFATDTYFIRPRFVGLSIISVECNYHLPILDQNVDAGIYPADNRNRVRQSHMSLDTCKEFIQAQDLRRVREIHLIHLSEANSDEALFKTEIESMTGKPVKIAPAWKGAK